MIGYVYLTTNIANDYVYIGQHHGTFTAKYFGKGRRIREALKQYGRDAFNVEVLQYCETQTELNNAEKYWIDKYRQTHNCYNVNCQCAYYNEQSYKKLRQSCGTQQHREHISAIQKGKTLTEKHKQNIANAERKSWTTERRAKQAERMYNVAKTDEVKAKISERNRGKIWVTNGIKTYQVDPDKLDEMLANNFTKGRRLK